MPIQLTVTDGVWFMGCELPAVEDVGADVVSDRLAEFALAIFERHGVDALGLGLSIETIQ